MKIWNILSLWLLRVIVAVVFILELALGIASALGVFNAEPGTRWVFVAMLMGAAGAIDLTISTMTRLQIAAAVMEQRGDFDS
jgi:hypothetical protein